MSVFNLRRLSVLDSTYGVPRQCFAGSGFPMGYGAACNAFIVLNRSILKNMMGKDKIMKRPDPTWFSVYQKIFDKLMHCCPTAGPRSRARADWGLVCECGKVFVDKSRESKTGLVEKACRVLLERCGYSVGGVEGRLSLGDL
jgi:hypothetical protein